MVHGDDFRNNKTEYFYSLKAGDKRYNLHFAQNPPQLLTDTKVSAKGVSLDSELVLASGTVSTSGSLKVTTAAEPNNPLGEQKTIVILADLATNPATTSVQEVKALMFTNFMSVNNYYKENSYNKTYFTGDVFGWYRIVGSCSTNRTDLSDAAYAAAVKAGINFSGYTRRVYVFPCPGGVMSGFGTHGGNPSTSWIFLPNQVQLYSHELGHNLGVDHANSLNCGLAAIAPYSQCTMTEYGDWYDVMGGSGTNLYHFNAPHKVAVGWVLRTKFPSVTTNGRYVLRAIEAENAEGIRILKNDTGEYYYLSFRKPIGFDASLPTQVTRGTNIHIASENGLGLTKMLDTTPQTSPLYLTDPALADGASFTDPINNIIITQVSHDSSTATVDIRLGSILKPDLTINSVTGPTTDITLGTDFSASAVMANIGTADTAQTFQMYFRILKLDLDRREYIPVYTQQVQIDTPLAKNTTVTKTTGLITTKAFDVGSYWFEVCADKNFLGTSGTIDELNENNNCGSGSNFNIETPKRVFVSSTYYAGNLGGVSGADTKCQLRANAANLGGFWRAWLSDGTFSASSRLTKSPNPYRLVNGTIVANSWIDLTDGTLTNPININESGGYVNSSNGVVHTNTTASGAIASANHCSNWTSSTGLGFYGLAGVTYSAWTQGRNSDCAIAKRLYCFEVW